MRGHRICFGYRNPIDLLFRDQSKDLAYRAQRSKRASQRRITESATNLPPADCDNCHARLKLDTSNHPDVTPTTPWYLPICPENQAFYFFSRNYPSQPSKNFKSIYEDIPALYHLEPSDSPLLYIIAALGLAGLSHHTSTSGIDIAATTWYDKALHKINNRLRDRVLAKADQTLLVVLLFGLYEVYITLRILERPKAYSLSDQYLQHT